MLSPPFPSQEDEDEGEAPSGAIERARAGALLPSDSLASRLVAETGDDVSSGIADGGAPAEEDSESGGEAGGGGEEWPLAGPDVEAL